MDNYRLNLQSYAATVDYCAKMAEEAQAAKQPERAAYYATAMACKKEKLNLKHTDVAKVNKSISQGSRAGLEFLIR